MSSLMIVSQPLFDSISNTREALSQKEPPYMAIYLSTKSGTGWHNLIHRLLKKAPNLFAWVVWLMGGVVHGWCCEWVVS